MIMATSHSQNKSVSEAADQARLSPSSTLFSAAFSAETVIPTSKPSRNPDEAAFTEYLSWTAPPDHLDFSGLTMNNQVVLYHETTHLLSLPSDPKTPVYAIKARLGTRAKPDAELHVGASLESPLRAVARLHVKNHDFGIAEVVKDGPTEDPGMERVPTKDGRGEEFMSWETLKQVTKWTNRVFEFEWGVRRERKKYTWLRTKETFPGSMREIELRVGERAQAEAGGECLVRWVREDKGTLVKKGNLYVKRRGANVEEEKMWESVALISFLIVLESAVRRG
jgi:hypothetical protein